MGIDVEGIMFVCGRSIYCLRGSMMPRPDILDARLEQPIDSCFQIQLLSDHCRTFTELQIICKIDTTCSMPKKQWCSKERQNLLIAILVLRQLSAYRALARNKDVSPRTSVQCNCLSCKRVSSLSPSDSEKQRKHLKSAQNSREAAVPSLG
jgi:hypothetical protein